MSTAFKSQMKEVMQMAWSFVRKNGYSMSEALKCAWANIKLKAALKKGIVKFFYQKLDGTVRTAWGTLKEGLIPETKGVERKKNESLITYYDKEKASYRSFKIANLIG